MILKNVAVQSLCRYVGKRSFDTELVLVREEALLSCVLVLEHTAI